MAAWCLTFLVGFKEPGYEGSEAGLWIRWGVRWCVEAGHADGEWLYLPVSTHTEACTFAVALIKSQAESQKAIFYWLLWKNDRLEWQTHQENYGYAPGASNPENLRGLQ